MFRLIPVENYKRIVTKSHKIITDCDLSYNLLHEVTCGFCNRHFLLDLEHKGNAVRCPRCQRIIAIRHGLSWVEKDFMASTIR